MTYKSVLFTRQGSPDVLQVVEHEGRPPHPGEVRVKLLCTGVGFTDVIMRYGYYPYAPKTPFVPGYEIIGTVDALGEGVNGFTLGQRVAALTVYGGYAEYIYLAPDDLVIVPDGLDSVKTLSLILNYVTAYQMLHRRAQVKAGQTVLSTGASGGVGNALLELGRLAGLKMYGTASRAKHDLAKQLGGIPIDYRTQEVAEVIRQQEPGGLDAVFDAIGPQSAWQGYRLLRRGGKLVAFGVTGTVQNGKANNLAGIAGFLLPTLTTLIPDGRQATFYGITQLYRQDKKPFREDLPKLFALLAARQIDPVIAAVLPLTATARANRMVEAGEVQGKLVLWCAVQPPTGWSLA